MHTTTQELTSAYAVSPVSALWPSWPRLMTAIDGNKQGTGQRVCRNSGVCIRLALLLDTLKLLVVCTVPDQQPWVVVLVQSAQVPYTQRF